MPKDNNLSDFLLDIADAIRFQTKKPDSINAQDFSTEIRNLPIGSGKDEVPIETVLDMQSGNQTVTPEDSTTQTMSKVTIIKPDTFIPGNIKKGVNIGGVEGTLEMGGTDISDTTAIAGDVRKGKVFYSSDGTKTQGTIENYGGASLSTLATTLSQKQYGMSAVAIGDKIYLHGQNKNFELFDTKTNTHSLLDAVTNRVTYYAPIAAVDNKIYLCGGGSSKNIVVFNPETNEVETKEVSYSLETGCSGASVGNKIYLFGSSKLSQGTMIYIYDIINNTLSKSNVVLPISAGEIAACAINDKIYLFGGHNEDTSTSIYGTFLDSINVFDAVNNTISTLNVTLPVKMANIGAAALGDKIYLFGGSSEDAMKHNTIYEFDTSTNTISELNTVLPDGFLGIAAAAANNKIYLFGGQSNSGLQSIIQEFDPKTSILITSKSGEVLETSGKYCVDNIYVYPKLQSKEITSNGTATADDGYVGLGSVTVNVPTTVELPTLNAPTISLNNSTLTITNPETNGNFATNFKVYKGSTLLTSTANTSIDLSSLITELGTYAITVRASGTNFNDSAASNSISYTVVPPELSTPAISLVSGTTIQIDTIDDNATTIEVFADGLSIGEVEKETSTGYTLTVGSISKTDNPDTPVNNDFGTLTLFKNGSSTGEVIDLLNLQNSDILAQGVTSIKFTYEASSGRYGNSSCSISSIKLGGTLSMGTVYQVTENIDDIIIATTSKADAPAD